MANEAVCIETPTEFARYTVADGTAISAGTLLKLSGDNTAIASSGKDVWAGVAWEDKTADDGITEIVAAMNGVFDLTNYATGTITLGSLVALSGANFIKDAIEAEEITGNIVGKALEAGSAAEVIRVRVGRTT